MKPYLVTLLLWAVSASGAGLFQDNIGNVLDKAKRQHKPVIINFYGIWCPPCNALKETVFVSPAFLQRAKSFELLQVDADQPGNWEIKSKYQVGGYPTVVFTTPSGGEIYRLVGYFSPEEFSRTMDFVLASKNKPAAKSCTSKDADDLWRCARRCMETKDHACAQRAARLLAKSLSKHLKPNSARYEIIKTYLAEQSENTDLKAQAFASLLKESPDSPLSLNWALAYFDAVTEQKNTPPRPGDSLLQAVLQAYPGMGTDSRRAELGLTVTDLAQLKAELLGRLEKTEEAKIAWKEAATLLQKMAADLPPGVTDRGFMLEQITCLDMAGESDQALALAEAYQAKFPSEFTFHFIAASILERRKRYNDALPIAQKAYGYSYGDNRIRVAILLVKLYATVPNKDAARQIYAEVKKGFQPDAKLEIRTHRYLKALDEAWKKLETA